MRAKRSDEEIPVTVSSGNVFADFGISNADELQTKVQIAFALNAILDRFGKMTQEQIADKFSIDQPKISALRNYKLEGLSVERLMGFLTQLDYDVDINIRPRGPNRDISPHVGRIHVNLKAA